MENDLISRSVLLEERPEYRNPNHVDVEKALFAKGWNACNSEYYSLITNAEAVDAEPVRHGEWVISESPAHLSTIKCSECGTMYQRRWKTYCNFCPECGAKMRGEENAAD